MTFKNNLMEKGPCTKLVQSQILNFGIGLQRYLRCIKVVVVSRLQHQLGYKIRKNPTTALKIQKPNRHTHRARKLLGHTLRVKVTGPQTWCHSDINLFHIRNNGPFSWIW